MNDAQDANRIKLRINAQPLLYWMLRLIAVVSLAASAILWPEGPPLQSLTTPVGFLLFAGTATHYLQKALFGIPFFRFQTLYYDFVVVASAAALLIAVQVLIR